MELVLRFDHPSALRERRVRIMPSYHCKKWSGNEPTLPRLAFAEGFRRLLGKD